MLDFNKLVNSTDFLEKLKALGPEKEKEHFEEWLNQQIEVHQKVIDDQYAKIQSIEQEGPKNDDEKSEG